MEQSGRKKRQKKNQWGWSMSSYQKRRISEQTYKFPKCIFPFFFFSIHDIYLFSVRCRSAEALCVALLLEHKIFSASWKCYVFGVAGGMETVGMGEKEKERKSEEGKWKGADWEKLRKINMWVIRKHKYWMIQVCEWGAKQQQQNFIRLCQSWRIYGTSYVFNSWQKRKQNEGIFSRSSLSET